MNQSEIELISMPLLGGTFYMKLPITFSPMSEEMIKLKYPSASRPEQILTNAESNVDYKFTYILENIYEDQLEQVIKEIKGGLRKVYTSIHYFDEKIYQNNKKKIGWFDFTSNAIGGKAYSRHGRN